MTKRDIYQKTIAYFTENMPVAETELSYSNAYELAVAVILSAQCTDKRVNMITPAFFKQFPTAKALAESNTDSIYQVIKSCSYPNNKAKNLLGMAKTLVDEFNGIMPDDVKTLQKLPGIGRKSANVIASVVFGKPAMAVDTHVARVSKRIGLVDAKAKTPLAIERQLVKNIPVEVIPKAHHWLILHGRYVCTARKPKCTECGLTTWCKYFKTGNAWDNY